MNPIWKEKHPDSYEALFVVTNMLFVILTWWAAESSSSQWDYAHPTLHSINCWLVGLSFLFPGLILTEILQWVQRTCFVVPEYDNGEVLYIISGKIVCKVAPGTMFWGKKHLERLFLVSHLPRVEETVPEATSAL